MSVSVANKMSLMPPIIPENKFFSLRRDLLLNYEVYYAQAQDFQQRIPRAASKLADPAWLKGRDDATLLRLTEARAEYALDLLSLSYSAGVDIDTLAAFYPDVLRFFEEFARYSIAYNASRGEGARPTPHLFLADVDFERAIRLLCFAILLGWQDEVPRVMAILDYNNTRKDGLLERLASCYTERPMPVPATCTRGLPYARTLAIFDAPTSTRAKMVHDYLAGWYDGSRREPYHDSDSGPWFRGYWSWEAAAVTRALGIDDRDFRHLPFYPRDMVDQSERLAANNRNLPSANTMFSS